MTGNAQGYKGACNEQFVSNGVEQSAGTGMPVETLRKLSVQSVREAGNEKQEQRDVVVVAQQQRKNRRNERNADEGNRVWQPAQGHAVSPKIGRESGMMGNRPVGLTLLRTESHSRGWLWQTRRGPATARTANGE